MIPRPLLHRLYIGCVSAALCLATTLGGTTQAQGWAGSLRNSAVTWRVTLAQAPAEQSVPPPSEPLPLSTATPSPRWSSTRSGLPGSPQPSFSVAAPVGTQVGLTQVSTAIYELSDLEVSGLGNAGDAALGQQLRAEFRTLAELGQSQSHALELAVLNRSPAGTELAIRWTEGSALSTEAESRLQPTVQLSQLLLPGGLRGPVQVSSPDAATQARYRRLPPSALDRLNISADAPYGLPLSAGERISVPAQRPVDELFRDVLSSIPALNDWALPSPAELPVLDLRREQVYQGQNSRGDHLFQTQGSALPWQQQLKGSSGSQLTLEVVDMAQMSQAVYRSDGLPHSSFEFSTMHLRVTAQSGAARVSFTVQLRFTSALRPVGS
ncbi:hypothetical protein [Deinococcus radiophilus]|uniref:hypothetical protein n=1 Tax=Deinococcus radiophilus TaxID=32062 RepID=UPI001E2E3E8C|nr:hypothetical protein [Deinococcus radiophilus]UFA50333.1 hypothetical protein LMT64_10780 [Deinococcus radiophilus]